MGVSQNYRYLFGGPYIKDYSILGSILGYLSFGTNYHIRGYIGVNKAYIRFRAWGVGFRA